MDKNKLAVNMFNKAAKLYEEKYMDVSSYTEGLDVFCEKLGYKDANILELGCGSGNITRYLTNKCLFYVYLKC
jgi:ubiquinone/menaquinone biosynthesis C-methylase UbiE